MFIGILIQPVVDKLLFDLQQFTDYMSYCSKRDGLGCSQST